jgi:hypothetical protein
MKVKTMILHDFLNKFDSQQKQFRKKVNKVKVYLISLTLFNAVVYESLFSLMGNNINTLNLSRYTIDILVLACVFLMKRKIMQRDQKNLAYLYSQVDDKNVLINDTKKILLILDNMMLSDEIKTRSLEKNTFSRWLKLKPRHISRDDFELLNKIKKSKFLEENYLLFEALNEIEQKNMMLYIKKILPHILKNIDSQIEQKYSHMNEIQLKQNILNLKEELFFNNIKIDLENETQKEDNVNNFEKNNIHIMYPKNNNIMYTQTDKNRLEKEKEKQKKLSL